MLETVAAMKPHSAINWNKSGAAFGERLYQSIEYLRFRAKNCNAIAACETVEKIVSERQKLRLFQKFFPDSWKASRTSFFKTGYYENYSERINEFFRLVNEKLFPLLNGWNEDPDINFENFWIYSLNLDLCCEEIEYESLRVSYVAGLLFYFQDEEIWEYFANHYKIEKDDFPGIRERPNDKIWRIEKTGKIELYANLFELVDHSTG